MGKTDERITTHEFDVETDQKVTKKLADMGINKIDDLAPGRQFDAGSAANHLMGIDPAVSPLLAEKIVRDDQFEKMAGHPANPTVGETVPPDPATPPAPSREEQLNADLVAAKAEADSWKQKYGERENKLGDERRRTAERLARLEGSGVATTTQNVSTGFTPSMQYDPRLLGGRDPDEPMTRAEVCGLLQSQTQALGAELGTRDSQILETTRQLRDYTVTPDQEVGLFEKYPMLANLPRGEQMALMRGLVPATTPTSTPSGTPPVPAKQDMVELARQRIRTATTYIEPSTQGSPAEASAAGEDNSTLAKKAMRLRELMDVTGASTDPKLGPEMERLMNELQGRRQ